MSGTGGCGHVLSTGASIPKVGVPLPADLELTHVRDCQTQHIIQTGLPLITRNCTMLEDRKTTVQGTGGRARHGYGGICSA